MSRGQNYITGGGFLLSIINIAVTSGARSKPLTDQAALLTGQMMDTDPASN